MLDLVAESDEQPEVLCNSVGLARIVLIETLLELPILVFTIDKDRFSFFVLVPKFSSITFENRVEQCGECDDYVNDEAWGPKVQ